MKKLMIVAMMAVVANGFAGEVVLTPIEGDATEMLQKAIADAATTKVTLQKGDYIVAKPILIKRKGFEIVLQDGARILAKKGAFHPIAEPMLDINGAQDLILRGEGNATLEMRLHDYEDPANGYKFSEWRHIALLRGAKNVTIRNLLFTHSGGDGIDMFGGTENVTVEDCRFIDNNRLGLGNSSVDGLTIRRCHFKGNNGTPPRGGIDFEPNYISDHLLNVLVEDCVFEDHDGCGFDLHVLQLSPQSKPVSVTLRNCVARNNRQGGYRVTATGAKGPVTGLITFENCRAEGNGGQDLLGTYIAKEGLQIKTVGCDFKKVDMIPWVKPEGSMPFDAKEVKALVPGKSQGAATTGWLRWGGQTFLQYVPGPGTYTVRFDLQECDSKQDPSVTVDVTDKLGTPLDTFTYGREGRDYTFKTVCENCIQFRIKMSGALAKVTSELPGAALRADRYVHMCETDATHAYRIKVPADCEEVRVGLFPEEPIAGVLLNPAGERVAMLKCDKVAGTLAAKRAKTAQDEVWTLVLKIKEDAKFKIGAPCPSFVELVPASVAK